MTKGTHLHYLRRKRKGGKRAYLVIHLGQQLQTKNASGKCRWMGMEQKCQHFSDCLFSSSCNCRLSEFAHNRPDQHHRLFVEDTWIFTLTKTFSLRSYTIQYSTWISNCVQIKFISRALQLLPILNPLFQGNHTNTGNLYSTYSYVVYWILVKAEMSVFGSSHVFNFLR